MGPRGHCGRGARTYHVASRPTYQVATNRMSPRESRLKHPRQGNHYPAEPPFFTLRMGQAECGTVPAEKGTKARDTDIATAAKQRRRPRGKENETTRYEKRKPQTTQPSRTRGRPKNTRIARSCGPKFTPGSHVARTIGDAASDRPRATGLKYKRGIGHAQKCNDGADNEPRCARHH